MVQNPILPLLALVSQIDFLSFRQTTWVEGSAKKVILDRYKFHADAIIMYLYIIAVLMHLPSIAFCGTSVCQGSDFLQVSDLFLRSL